MEKDQLISMIHFLEKCDEESRKENQELKELIMELRSAYKQDMKIQSNLIKSIDRLTNQMESLAADNSKLQRLVDELQKEI